MKEDVETIYENGELDKYFDDEQKAMILAFGREVKRMFA